MVGVRMGEGCDKIFYTPHSLDGTAISCVMHTVTLSELLSSHPTQMGVSMISWHYLVLLAFIYLHISPTIAHPHGSADLLVLRSMFL